MPDSLLKQQEPGQLSSGALLGLLCCWCGYSQLCRSPIALSSSYCSPVGLPQVPQDQVEGALSSGGKVVDTLRGSWLSHLEWERGVSQDTLTSSGAAGQGDSGAAGQRSQWAPLSMQARASPQAYRASQAACCSGVWGWIEASWAWWLPARASWQPPLGPLPTASCALPLCSAIQGISHPPSQRSTGQHGTPCRSTRARKATCFFLYCFLFGWPCRLKMASRGACGM